MFGFEVNPPFEKLCSTNSILSAKVNSFYSSSYTTNLTLKTVISGEARYATRQSVYTVEPGNCLVLNRGQTYDLDISPDTGTKTLAIFLEPRFVQSSILASSLSDEYLLDVPNPEVASDSPFIETIQPTKSSRLGDALRRITTCLGQDPEGKSWLEDSFYELVDLLPDLNSYAARCWSKLSKKKLSTRREIFKRLAHARDYAYSCYSENLSVDRLAEIAEMSPHHFHRMFRIAFGVTPNLFVRERRLDVAFRMLKRGVPVTQVSLNVGYEGLGSFCTLFKSRFGITPRKVRDVK